MRTECKQSLFLPDEEATVELGEKLGSVVQPFLAESCAVIYLIGDLGAGKTTLSRGVLKSFGHTGAVKSPTYTLVEPYDFGVQQVRHFDLYRLGDPEELEYMGIRDYFTGGNLCLIEWPNKGEGILPQADLIVNVAVKLPGRQLDMVAITALGQTIVQQIQA